MKTCKICEESKEYSFFYKDKSKKDGFDIYCKQCNKIRKAKFYLENKEIINQRNYNWKESNREKLKEYSKLNYILNKDKIKKVKKEYRLKNKERIKIKNKEYWVSRGREMSRIRNKERLKNDPLFKLRRNIKSLIYDSIRKNEFTKNSKTEDILGCSFDHFKMYIEDKFLEGMDWSNHGKWHLDHKTPISCAETEEQVYELNKYTNFQPLWAFDNLSKGNRYEG